MSALHGIKLGLAIAAVVFFVSQAQSVAVVFALVSMVHALISIAAEVD